MRALLVAVAAVVMTVMPTIPAGAAEGNPFPGPVGGTRLGSTPTPVADGATPPAGLQAGAWLVADLGTGEVLAAKAPHAKMRPASTLKTLTSLVLLPRLKKTDRLVGRYEDAAIEGSKVGVHPGLRYSVDLLFQGMFLASGNDAVHALAAHDAGGVPATVARMNATAALLGAFDTHVTDPTGLDADGQYSSAYDLALFARAGLQRADFRRYVSTKLVTYPLADGKGRYQVANQNKLLWSYPGAIGVKTGYTTLARNTFIGAATRGGRTLVVTLLNAPHGVTKEATVLLDWAFAHRSSLRPIGKLVTPEDVARARGSTSMPRTLSHTEPEHDVGPLPHAKTAGGAIAMVRSRLLAVPVWIYAVPPLIAMAWFLRPRRTRARRARR